MDIKTDRYKEIYDKLIWDGFCVIKNILQEDMLSRLRLITSELLSQQTEQERAAHRSSGSMISVYSHSIFSELVVYPQVLQALDTLGFIRPKWSSGYVISKPPKSPPLFWHQDWWGWNDPCSYTPLPQQLFLMYYLVDTSPDNGCLRIIKGSHLKRHKLHDILPAAHAAELQQVKDIEHPAFRIYPDEIDVPVNAGDLVIGDSRLLHASHSNQTEEDRTVITLWYHPYYDLLPSAMRAHIGRLRQSNMWTDEDWERISELTPVYNGETEPIKWNRSPGPDLI